MTIPSPWSVSVSVWWSRSGGPPPAGAVAALRGEIRHELPDVGEQRLELLARSAPPRPGIARPSERSRRSSSFQLRHDRRRTSDGQDRGEERHDRERARRVAAHRRLAPRDEAEVVHEHDVRRGALRPRRAAAGPSGGRARPPRPRRGRSRRFPSALASASRSRERLALVARAGRPRSVASVRMPRPHTAAAMMRSSRAISASTAAAAPAIAGRDVRDERLARPGQATARARRLTSFSYQARVVPFSEGGRSPCEGCEDTRPEGQGPERRLAPRHGAIDSFVLQPSPRAHAPLSASVASHGAGELCARSATPARERRAGVTAAITDDDQRSVRHHRGRAPRVQLPRAPASSGRQYARTTSRSRSTSNGRTNAPHGATIMRRAGAAARRWSRRR